MDVTGKVAIVTGAASGIGRASAVAFARAGAVAVAVVDVDPVAGKETVALVEAEGAEAAFFETDVGDPAQLEAMFAQVEARFGGVDIVHNNAGVVSGDPPWPGTPPSRMKQVIDVNVGGVFLGTRFAVDALRRRGGGAVVNTASVTALGPMPTDPTYAATKAAIVSFTQSCADLKEEGIRVSAILPGMVDTSMIAKTGDGTRPAAWLSPFLGMMVLLEPDAIAEQVVALVRDDKAGETHIVANEMTG